MGILDYVKKGYNYCFYIYPFKKRYFKIAQDLKPRIEREREREREGERERVAII